MGKPNLQKALNLALDGAYGDERIESIHALARFGNDATQALYIVAMRGAWGDERKIAIEHLGKIPLEISGDLLQEIAMNGHAGDERLLAIKFLRNK